MSSEQDRIRAVAERIARRLSQNGENKNAQAVGETNVASELAMLQIELAELRKKLAHVESHITHDETCTEAHALPPPRHREEQRNVGQPREIFSAVEKNMPLSSSTYITAVGATHAGHPSGERFEVGEAVSELVNFFEREEVCKMEPGDKPCDHCLMCSTQGF